MRKRAYGSFFLQGEGEERELVKVAWQRLRFLSSFGERMGWRRWWTE